MRYPVLITLVLLETFILSGCNRQQAAAPAPVVPEVTVATPLVQQIADWDEFVGQFEAVDQVAVRPRVTGYLVAVSFKEGAVVQAGDLLFQVDDRPFQATLDEARARLSAAKARAANARKQFARAMDLVRSQSVSVETRDSLQSAALSAEADVTAAEAAVRSAQLDVEFTRITAPISGRVSYRRVGVGNVVKADETILTTITSVDPIHFVFQSSEALYLKYQRSKLKVREAPVRIRLQDEAKPAWSGHLDFLDNTLDPASGTIRGRAVVANPDGFLTPGLFGHMEIQTSDKYNGILLPDSAIATRGAQRIVYVVNARGQVGVKVVSLGPLHEGLRIIRSGLTAADRVIIEGLQRARPGQQVRAGNGTIAIPKESAADADDPGRVD